MNTAVLLPVLLLLGTGQMPCKAYIATPQLVMAEISARGRSEVLSELYDSWASGRFTSGSERPPFDCWTPVLESISGGSKKWLEVALRLLEEMTPGRRRCCSRLSTMP